MTQNVDQEEIEKFASHAAHWWDETGPLKTLHQLNPLRLSYIKEKTNLANKKIIDIGCGGGILSESLSKAGAIVTGIDMNEAAIEVANLHQLESKTNVEYQVTTAEEIAASRQGEYDIVVCLEMLEHVPDPASIVKAAAALLKPGGHAFFSTLNRNPKSYLFAIIGAEYILKLLPRNTHDYAKFIKPSELNRFANEVGLQSKDIRGVSYHPFKQTFRLTTDVSINYLFYAVKSHDNQ